MIVGEFQCRRRLAEYSVVIRLVGNRIDANTDEVLERPSNATCVRIEGSEAASQLCKFYPTRGTLITATQCDTRNTVEGGIYQEPHKMKDSILLFG